MKICQVKFVKELIKSLVREQFFKSLLVSGLLMWMPCSFGLFSTRSLYRSLEEMPGDGVPSSLLWCGLALPTVEVFCWLAVLGKVSALDNLRRRGLRSEGFSKFVFALRWGRGIHNHLFIHCKFSFSLCKRSFLDDAYHGAHLNPWLAWCFVSFFGCGAMLWRLVPFAIVWPLWNERNGRIPWQIFYPNCFWDSPNGCWQGKSSLI